MTYILRLRVQLFPMSVILIFGCPKFQILQKLVNYTKNILFENFSLPFWTTKNVPKLIFEFIKLIFLFWCMFIEHWINPFLIFCCGNSWFWNALSKNKLICSSRGSIQSRNQFNELNHFNVNSALTFLTLMLPKTGYIISPNIKMQNIKPKYPKIA